MCFTSTFDVESIFCSMAHYKKLWMICVKTHAMFMLLIGVEDGRPRSERKSTTRYDDELKVCKSA
ncbi:hypothetical protein [Lysinibacillus sp. G4S2]|uniref:hypothetical protein n=1 Tax=Lysinibacillus sp. G4S2 TaxID=3055859 RepID=UPI0025A0410C|nr:hypothetical protein [Lysinibacillus sp. G4S2]MDM5249719.1 hypothetical protein [Lysinibacillus sp. G4S2]